MVANLSNRQKAIAGLTVATAVMHIILGFLSDGFFMILFILNGLGFLVLLAALYFIPQLTGQRRLIRWALFGLTAVTFILYFVRHWPDLWGPVGIINKLIELALMILLLREK
ncbi:hypothetical protein MNBD_CHLOROFLEXI01-3846 [hydrothermal vent metagenome]|uniref:Uncharacterized protein n=1 Tax=hydrothermal vent metagenome TaxID=652676 RepID=A0A3B0V5C5_9ZZZZ